MRKIVMVTPYYAPKHGGVVRHVEQLINHLPDDYHITIITRPHIPSLPKRERIGRANIIRLPHLPSYAYPPIFLSHSLRSLLQHADIIHLHDPSPWLWSILSLLLVRRSFFVTLHGWEGRPPTFRDMNVRKLIVRTARKTLCVGSFIQQLYHVHCDEVIYNAPSPLFHPARPKEYLTFIGRFDADTDYPALARTIPIVFAHYSSLKKVILIGDGPLKESVHTILKENTIPFTDIGFTDTPHEYVNHSLLTFPAGYQSILESLAAGALPILSVQNNEREAYLSTLPLAPCLLLLKQNAHTTLQSSLESFTLYTEKRMRACQHVLTREYTWHAVAQAYLSLWKT